MHPVEPKGRGNEILSFSLSIHHENYRRHSQKTRQSARRGRLCDVHSAEKKAIAYNPTIRIETVSDYDRFRSAETKKSEGTKMFDDEKRIYDKMGGNPQRAESELERTQRSWTRCASCMLAPCGSCAKSEVCGSGGIPPDGSDWCRNITPNTTDVHKKKTCRTRRSCR